MSKPLDPKYRPYLSRSQIELLLTKLEGDTSTTASEIKVNFNLLLMKANAGIATGSYIPKKRKNITDSLGFGYDNEEEQRYLNGEMTEEEEILYQNKLMNPTDPSI